MQVGRISTEHIEPLHCADCGGCGRDIIVGVEGHCTSCNKFDCENWRGKFLAEFIWMRF